MPQTCVFDNLRSSANPSVASYSLYSGFRLADPGMGTALTNNVAQPIVVDIDGSSARVQIVGGTSMVLPSAGDGYYSNGRYGFRGGGANGQWEVGRMAPASCTGS